MALSAEMEKIFQQISSAPRKDSKTMGSEAPLASPFHGVPVPKQVSICLNSFLDSHLQFYPVNCDALQGFLTRNLGHLLKADALKTIGDVECFASNSRQVVVAVSSLEGSFKNRDNFEITASHAGQVHTIPYSGRAPSEPMLFHLHPHEPVIKLKIFKSGKRGRRSVGEAGWNCSRPMPKGVIRLGVTRNESKLKGISLSYDFINPDKGFIGQVAKEYLFTELGQAIQDHLGLEGESLSVSSEVQSSKLALELSLSEDCDMSVQFEDHIHRFDGRKYLRIKCSQLPLAPELTLISSVESNLKKSYTFQTMTELGRTGLNHRATTAHSLSAYEIDLAQATKFDCLSSRLSIKWDCHVLNPKIRAQNLAAVLYNRELGSKSDSEALEWNGELNPELLEIETICVEVLMKDPPLLETFLNGLELELNLRIAKMLAIKKEKDRKAIVESFVNEFASVNFHFLKANDSPIFTRWSTIFSGCVLEHLVPILESKNIITQMRGEVTFTLFKLLREFQIIHVEYQARIYTLFQVCLPVWLGTVEQLASSQMKRILKLEQDRHDKSNWDDWCERHRDWFEGSHDLSGVLETCRITWIDLDWPDPEVNLKFGEQLLDRLRIKVFDEYVDKFYRVFLEDKDFNCHECVIIVHAISNWALFLIKMFDHTKVILGNLQQSDVLFGDSVMNIFKSINDAKTKAVADIEKFIKNFMLGEQKRIEKLVKDGRLDSDPDDGLVGYLQKMLQFFDTYLDLDNPEIDLITKENVIDQYCRIVQDCLQRAFKKTIVPNLKQQSDSSRIPDFHDALEKLLMLVDVMEYDQRNGNLFQSMLHEIKMRTHKFFRGLSLVPLPAPPCSQELSLELFSVPSANENSPEFQKIVERSKRDPMSAQHLDDSWSFTRVYSPLSIKWDQVQGTLTNGWMPSVFKDCQDYVPDYCPHKILWTTTFGVCLTANDWDQMDRVIEDFFDCAALLAQLYCEMQGSQGKPMTGISTFNNSTRTHKWSTERDPLKEDQVVLGEASEAGVQYPEESTMKARGNKDSPAGNAPDDEDPFEKAIESKRERVAKNEVQRLRNIARAKSVKIPKVGVTPMVAKQSNTSTDLKKAAALAQKSTASVGKFQPKLSGALEKSVKPPRGKKRQFDPLVSSTEKEKNLKIFEQINKKAPKLDMNKAVGREMFREDQERKEEKQSGKKSGKGGRFSKKGGRANSKKAAGKAIHARCSEAGMAGKGRGRGHLLRGRRPLKGCSPVFGCCKAAAVAQTTREVSVVRRE
eukprot:maker-scaffold9_size846264-snap-gene-2.16 protein:Tk08389 transcript:maker-scaffold9_size846264-snap-gene-2.16-mRNA-1 annotation:"ribosome biogenesis regulatory protein homolog"